MTQPMPASDTRLPIDRWVDELARMSVAERHAAIEAYRFPANIGSLIREAAAQTPDTTALSFFEAGRTLTYAELDRMVDRVALALAAQGVAFGDKVGVMLPNIPEFPLCWLALMRIGAVMVPVNLRYTGRELAYVLDDSQARFLVIHDTCAEQLRAARAGAAGSFPADERIVLVGAAAGGALARFEDIVAATAEGGRYEGVEPGHDTLANIQYTSGTTGFPKGCMLTHRYWLGAGLVNAVRDGKRFHRVLAATPFFYMDPQWLLILAAYHRGTLFVAARQSASRFAGWLREHRINFCLFPEIVMKQPEAPGERLTELRRANIYGVRKQAHARLRERFNAPAMEAFGMTEVGPCLYMPLDATDMIGSGSCGIPAPFRQVRIVDETGADVPAGEIGELVVRGPGIMQGYYRREDANRDSFFGEWFRTGDLFRRDERGYHYIVGRLKDMVRRAGENIAAREVEAVLRNMDEVEEAAVVPVPDPMRGEEVKAYIQPRDPAEAGDALIGRILAHCAGNLAAFKVPRYLEFVSEIPRTASQKMAKSKLVEGRADLRQGSFDRVEGRWI